MTEQAYRLHEDVPLFREAVNFTAARTGFLPRLIEKDYFCTVLLSRLIEAKDLVFKGGTCLAKVHAGFYRLSEDLDFTIPMAVDASRGDCRRAVEPVKDLIAHIAEHQPAFTLSSPLTGELVP
jgi:predicted nucleotidyltransferase component of viral defense system